MKRFVEGEDRRQGVLLPEYFDDFVAEENQVRVIEAFVDELDLRGLGFEGVVPEATGRPAYHPATMLKIYVYGYVKVRPHLLPARRGLRRLRRLRSSRARSMARSRSCGATRSRQATQGLRHVAHRQAYDWTKPARHRRGSD
jgi:hypothetical protein